VTLPGFAFGTVRQRAGHAGRPSNGEMEPLPQGEAGVMALGYRGPLELDEDGLRRLESAKQGCFTGSLRSSGISVTGGGLLLA
jgi:hypothetical protein